MLKRCRRDEAFLFNLVHAKSFTQGRLHIMLQHVTMRSVVNITLNDWEGIQELDKVLALLPIPKAGPIISNFFCGGWGQWSCAQQEIETCQQWGYGRRQQGHAKAHNIE